LVEIGSGPGKSTTSLATIAGFDVTIVSFERDERQYECAQTVVQHAREQAMSVTVQLLKPY
jgi:predicted O-methyltransferase YrrM